MQAQGTRFAYIVDISGSMSVGAKMDTLKSALDASIGALAEGSSFVVCPYSAEPELLGGKGNWTDANGRGKNWARQQVSRLAPRATPTPAPRSSSSWASGRVPTPFTS